MRIVDDRALVLNAIKPLLLYEVLNRGEMSTDVFFVGKAAAIEFSNQIIE